MRQALLGLLAAFSLLNVAPAAATTGVLIGRFGAWSLETMPPMIPLPGQPDAPMRYLGTGQARDFSVRWDLEFEGGHVDVTLMGQPGCSGTERRSTIGLDDQGLAQQIESALSLQTAQLQLTGCLARPSTAVIELRHARADLVAMLGALRSFRRQTRDPMQ